ncbi:D-alanyl-D-alanine carboxypeptidase (plasmid) [Cytobacillus firmus]|uniref:D-alanyl-D-alanine carboxypeptidase family protein n=1 Tax=Bacillaceae TaxID=186817 RepID=UPI001A8E8B02|nr:D-alanyl-D-alanine carboxypeptidase family protein [Bacillus sp. NTK034]MBN8202782.1 D-alanyl-D-alanine carboxypeptidase [Bacillus sp. NTK034]
MKLKILLLILFTSNLYFSDKTFAENNPAILSESAILMDSKTGAVLFEKNSSKKMYPASLTKVTTAIYALEKGNINDIVTVSKNARQVEGTRVYLEEGEKVQLRKLVQGLLINSGNDAGVAIAEHLDGSVEIFAKNLNSYLKRLGVKNTNYENPHGLFNPNHVTTAEDLAKITQYAMYNEEFRQIFGTKELEWIGESWKTTLFTHHKLMRENPYEGITGGKTGFVDQSGHTLITTAKRDNISLIVVTLKSSTQEMANNDTIELLDYGFDHYQTSYIPKGTIFTANDNQYSTKKDFYFTQDSKESVINKVDEKGILEIMDQNQELVASVQLENVQKKSDDLNRKQKESTESSLGLDVYKGSLLILSLAYSVLLLRKKVNQKRRRKGWL